MTRNPGTSPAWLWLSNSTIPKFCHLSYMVIISHNFKALLSLPWLPHPTISKFYQPFTIELFQIGNSSFYFFITFLEIGRNYIMSIIITIVSNITVSVSQNMIFFGFFMLTSHGVNKKTPPSASPNPLFPTRLSPGFVLQEMLDQPSIAVIRLFAKDNAFWRK